MERSLTHRDRWPLFGSLIVEFIAQIDTTPLQRTIKYHHPPLSTPSVHQPKPALIPLRTFLVVLWE